ncbi:unnamed protein product, partial [Rhizoctonia solani]
MAQVFEVPEVLCLICEQVQWSELVQLLTVSRLFFDCAVPLVWSSLPGSAPTILMKLLPDGGRYLNTSLSSTLVASQIDNLNPLDIQALVRFNRYAPYVKQLVRYYQNKQSNVIWDRLLKLIDARPILPNLQVLKVSLGATIRDPVAYISAYLSPHIVEIAHVRDAYSFIEPQSLCNLVSCIAQKCPRIRSLRLTNAATHMYIVMKPAHTSELANSLSQLRNLRVFGLGRVVLDPKVLKALGALPYLESLTLNEAPGNWGPGEVPKPTGTSLSHNSFPALRHIGINARFRPEPAIRAWDVTALVGRLTSVSVRIDTPLTQVQANGFIRAVCHSSPFVTALCLDCTDSPSYVMLLSLDIIAHLAKLPLQRLWLSGKESYFTDTHRDKEQFVVSFPRMEYLRIKGYYFTLKDLGSFAKHMPRLQQLSVRFEIDTSCPTIGQPSLLALAPSSSQLYLHFRIFRSVEGRRYMAALPRGNSQDVEAIAAWLYALWPNGVICETDRRPDEK